jgi:hypothetical protein
MRKPLLKKHTAEFDELDNATSGRDSNGNPFINGHYSFGKNSVNRSGNSINQKERVSIPIDWDYIIEKHIKNANQ